MMPMRRQRSIRKPVSLRGTGLHSGQQVQMRLLPASPGTGIIFRRTDLPEQPVIRASVEYVAETNHCTALRDHGVAVRTVEHLLAACAGCGVDNLVAELDGEEVPILDGSALPFVQLLRSAGVMEQDRFQPYLEIIKAAELRDDGRVMLIRPSSRFSITCAISHNHPLLSFQAYTYNEQVDFVSELAAARTYGFLDDVEALRKNGLARGGSLENAVVLGPDVVVNPEGLRYEDECVRHKVLDLLGDLALTGFPIVGEVVAFRPGHALNVKLATLLRQDSLARIVTEPS